MSSIPLSSFLSSAAQVTQGLMLGKQQGEQAAALQQQQAQEEAQRKQQEEYRLHQQKISDDRLADLERQRKIVDDAAAHRSSQAEKRANWVPRWNTGKLVYDSNQKEIEGIDKTIGTMGPEDQQRAMARRAQLTGENQSFIDTSRKGYESLGEGAEGEVGIAPPPELGMGTHPAGVSAPVSPAATPAPAATPPAATATDTVPAATPAAPSSAPAATNQAPIPGMTKVLSGGRLVESVDPKASAAVARGIRATARRLENSPADAEGDKARALAEQAPQGPYTTKEQLIAAQEWAKSANPFTLRASPQAEAKAGSLTGQAVKARKEEYKDFLGTVKSHLRDNPKEWAQFAALARSKGKAAGIDPDTVTDELRGPHETFQREQKEKADALALKKREKAAEEQAKVRAKAQLNAERLRQRRADNWTKSRETAHKAYESALSRFWTPGFAKTDPEMKTLALHELISSAHAAGINPDPFVMKTIRRISGEPAAVKMGGKTKLDTHQQKILYDARKYLSAKNPPQYFGAIQTPVNDDPAQRLYWFRKIDELTALSGDIKARASNRHSYPNDYARFQAAQSAPKPAAAKPSTTSAFKPTGAKNYGGGVTQREVDWAKKVSDAEFSGALSALTGAHRQQALRSYELGKGHSWAGK